MTSVVDTCGWISYFLKDGNADFFGAVIEQTDTLLVPSIVVYEVSKKISLAYEQSVYLQVMRYLKLGQFIGVDWDLMINAAAASKHYRLHMSDAIIWQTAQSHNALLYTQDAAFEGLPGVVYRAKSPTA